MRKILIIIGIFALLPLVGFGIYFFDLLYYQAKTGSAEKSALSYMEKKYNEKFVVDLADYSKALGDDTGWFTIDVHPVKKPEISIRLSANENFQIDHDDYSEMKWRNDAILEYRKLLQPFFPNLADMYVNPTIPESIRDQYGLSDTYQTILSHASNQVSEYVHIVTFANSTKFTEEVEWEKLYGLSSVLMQRQIKEWTIQLIYYPEKLLKNFQSMKDPHQFENEYWRDRLLFCRFSSDQVHDLNSASGIAEFCRK
ncbi:hypothetical protein [Pseudoneobacillus sp. C159]